MRERCVYARAPPATTTATTAVTRRCLRRVVSTVSAVAVVALAGPLARSSSPPLPLPLPSPRAHALVISFAHARARDGETISGLRLGRVWRRGGRDAGWSGRAHHVDRRGTRGSRPRTRSLAEDRSYIALSMFSWDRGSVLYENSRTGQRTSDRSIPAFLHGYLQTQPVCLSAHL